MIYKAKFDRNYVVAIFRREIPVVMLSTCMLQGPMTEQLPKYVPNFIRGFTFCAGSAFLGIGLAMAGPAIGAPIKWNWDDWIVR